MIFQIATLYNAYSLGWTIKKIDDRTYELTKKINDLNNFELDMFLNRITTFDKLPGINDSITNAMIQNI